MSWNEFKFGFAATLENVVLLSDKKNIILLNKLVKSPIYISLLYVVKPIIVSKLLILLLAHFRTKGV